MIIKFSRIILVFILIIGFFLRFIGIDWGLPSKTGAIRTFYVDESIILMALSEMNPSKFDFNPHHFNNGTSYFYLTGITLKVCSLLGIFTLSSNMDFYRHNIKSAEMMFAIGRYMSIFFGILTIYLVYIIGKRVYNKNIGLLSAFITAIMPLHIIDSHYMYFDMPLTFFFTLTLLISLKIYENPKLKWYILAGIVSALACGTKYYGGISLFFPLYAHIIRTLPTDKNLIFTSLKISKNTFFDKKILIFLGSFVFSFFLTNPYLILAHKEAMEQIIGSVGLAGFSNFSLNSIVGSNEGIIKGNNFLFYTILMTFALGIPLTISSIAGFFLNLVKINKKISILLFAFLSYYILMSLCYTKMENYLCPIIPILAIFSASIFLLRNLILRLVMVLVLFYTLLYSFGYVDIMANKSTHLLSSRWIRENIPQESNIGVIKLYFYTPPVLYSGIHLMSPYEKMELLESQKVWAGYDVKKIEQIRLITSGEKPVKYHLEWVGYDLEKLKKKLPEYFVISDFEYDENFQAWWKGWGGTSIKEKRQFLNFLMNERVYTNIKTFTEYPSVFGIKLDTRKTPWHIRYIKPEIRIYKLKK